MQREFFAGIGQGNTHRAFKTGRPTRFDNTVHYNRPKDSVRLVEETARTEASNSGRGTSRTERWDGTRNSSSLSLMESVKPSFQHKKEYMQGYEGMRTQVGRTKVIMPLSHIKPGASYKNLVKKFPKTYNMTTKTAYDASIKNGMF